MFPGLTFNIAASPAARTGPGASQSTPGASRRAASTGTLASQQKQQAVTPSSEEGLKQRGRPTEAPIPKAKKLMDEFKLAPPEHPKFFGAERATQAKAFTRLISVLSEEAQLTEDAEQDVELRRHKKCIEIMQSITKAYNVSKGHTFVSAVKEATSYATIEPAVELDWFPGWMLKERFRMEIGMFKGAEFWTQLKKVTLLANGYTEDSLDNEVVGIIADKLVECGRRESVATLPGACIGNHPQEGVHGRFVFAL